MLRSNAIRTYLSGLLGRGIGGSRSPEMHEREAAALHVPLVYRAIDFSRLGYGDERLDEIVRMLQQLGFDGVNVTHPFKERVLASLDSVSADAAALGAVNTVVFREGSRQGFNTDWSGFRTSFERGLPNAELREIALIGAGGAGAAVAYALLKMGTGRLRGFDTDRARAAALIRRIGALFPTQAMEVSESAKHALSGAQGIVQTSPIGMSAHPGIPFDPALLRPDMWVADIVYFPIDTELLIAARRLGCRSLSGGGMAVEQAANAFRFITGIEPSAARMAASF